MRNESWIGRFLPSREAAAIFGFVCLIYVEHVLFGANRPDLSLFFALAQLLVLTGVLASGWGRRALAGAPLLWLAIPFLLVLAGAVFSVIPVGGRIGHPLWTYVSPKGGSVSLDPVATRLEIVKLMGLAATFLTTVAIASKREWADTLLKAFSWVGGVFAAWAFLSWTTDPAAVFGVVKPVDPTRFSADFLSSNSAATLFACQSLLQVCLVIRAIRRAPKPLFSWRAWGKMEGLPTALILLFINLSCLILTQSRAGAMAAFAGMALVVALFALVRTDERSATGGIVAVGGLLLAAAVGLVLLSGSSLLGRLHDNPMTDLRFSYYQAYWRSFLASPWWGYGMGAFHAVNFQSMTDELAVQMGVLGAAHNVYLQWLLQSGLIGFVPMMACMLAVIAAILVGFRRRSRQQVVMIVALGVVAIFAIHGMTDFALEEPSLAAYFAAILGMGFGVATRG